jgi:hypothetical protein
MKRLSVEEFNYALQFDASDFDETYHEDEDGELVANSEEAYQWMEEFNRVVEFVEKVEEILQPDYYGGYETFFRQAYSIKDLAEELLQ